MQQYKAKLASAALRLRCTLLGFEHIPAPVLAAGRVAEAFQVFEWMVDGRGATGPVPAVSKTFETLMRGCHQTGAHTEVAGRAWGAALTSWQVPGVLKSSAVEEQSNRYMQLYRPHR